MNQGSGTALAASDLERVKVTPSIETSIRALRLEAEPVGTWQVEHAVVNCLRPTWVTEMCGSSWINVTGPHVRADAH